MRNGILIACVAFTLVTSSGLTAQRAIDSAPSAQQLYQRGLIQEHARGDLTQAIALYRQAAAAAGGDRALAAKALVRLGASQEKVGANADAIATYANVTRAYPEQHNEMAIAQQRLTVLRPSHVGERGSISPASSSAKPVIEKYCLNCHNLKTRSGGLDLDALTGAALTDNSAEWEVVMRRLRVRLDPPAHAPRPDESTYRGLIARLERDLDKAYATRETHQPVERVSEIELAARLAALLWNGAPDAALLDAARRGELRDPSVLHREVVRMLRDSRSASLVDTFFTPWLSLDRAAASHEVDNSAPRIDPDLLQSMKTETKLFLESQLQEDRDPVEVWTANYTFLDERLARHYVTPGVSGPQFRRVVWPSTDRAGLLGQAGPLAGLSLTTRTSPTVRGLFVWTRFLGLEAPPPPANVPALAEQPPSPGSMRDRLLAHKTNPSCARCHSLFDPLGLALEQFDAMGRTQTIDAGVPIDASGTFVDGTQFDRAEGLRAKLLQYRESYYQTLTEQLLTHALGRRGKGGRVYDYEMPVVRKIVRDASIGGYRWSSIIAGIAASAPFQAKQIVP